MNVFLRRKIEDFIRNAYGLNSYVQYVRKLDEGPLLIDLTRFQKRLPQLGNKENKEIGGY